MLLYVWPKQDKIQIRVQLITPYSNYVIIVFKDKVGVRIMATYVITCLGSCERVLVYQTIGKHNVIQQLQIQLSDYI